MVALGGPVIPDVVLEVLHPDLCSWIVRENCLNDVLMLKFVVVCMFQQVDTIREVGQSNVVSAQEFCLVLFKMILYFLQAGWQLLSNINHEMLVFLFVGIKKWYLEFSGFCEPSILGVDEHINLVGFHWVGWAWVEARAILGFI